MAKKKVIDKLAQETAQAKAAGVSYGKWKAMQPHVAIETKPLKEGYDKHVCPECKAEFVTLDNSKRIYCGDVCKKRAENRARREREMAAK